MAVAAPEPAALELHQGLDYAVLMRPGETTDSAFIQVSHPDDDDIELLRVLAAAPVLLTALREADAWLEAALGLIEGNGPPNWDGIRAHRNVIAAAIKATAVPNAAATSEPMAHGKCRICGCRLPSGEDTCASCEADDDVQSLMDRDRE